jgi:4-hydroxybenzoate polyprenyltransferase
MKLSTALRLGRVSNLPTTWTNVGAGVALSGAAVTPGHAAALCAAISLFYVGGMYLNDAFDAEYDRQQRAERPIPRGEVTARAVFVLGFSMLALGVVVVDLLVWLRGGLSGVAPSRLPTLSALALCVTVVFYDAYHKQNPLSPVVMAVTRVLVYVTAALSVRAAFTPALGVGCALLFCYMVGLTYAAKQENLREPRGMWPLGLLELPFLLFALAEPTPVRLGMYALLASWIGYCLVFLLDPRRRNIKRAVGYLIAGISLLDALLVASQGHLLGAGLCVLGFFATLVAQRFVPGT